MRVLGAVVGCWGGAPEVGAAGGVAIASVGPRARPAHREANAASFRGKWRFRPCTIVGIPRPSADAKAPWVEGGDPRFVVFFGSPSNPPYPCTVEFTEEHLFPFSEVLDHES